MLKVSVDISETFFNGAWLIKSIKNRWLRILFNFGSFKKSFLSGSRLQQRNGERSCSLHRLFKLRSRYCQARRIERILQRT